MTNKGKGVFIIGFTIWIVMFLLTVVLSITQPRQIAEILGNNQITEFSLHREYFSELGEIAVSNEKLYVVYQNMGVIEVYDLEGNYIKSYAYESKGKGHDQLTVDKTGLWLKTDHGKVFFIHKDGEITEKSLSEYINIRKELLPHSETWNVDSRGAVYQKRIISVYKKMPDGSSEPVIKRPIYCVLAEYIIPLNLIVIIVSFVITKKRGT